MASQLNLSCTIAVILNGLKSSKITVFVFAISFLPFLSPGDGTTYNIQSGDNACDAVNETGCTYSYYVLSNGTNVVVGVVDVAGMEVLFPCYLKSPVT